MPVVGVISYLEVVRDIFFQYFDKVIWFQNSSMYHFSMYHASHHIVHVPATEMEVEAEANAVKAVAEALCPLTIVLDKVILTSTCVVLGCWQIDTCNGFYCNYFSPNKPYKPTMWTEAWTVWVMHCLVIRLYNLVGPVSMQSQLHLLLQFKLHMLQVWRHQFQDNHNLYFLVTPQFIQGCGSDQNAG